jgi:hypothetical protein
MKPIVKINIVKHLSQDSVREGGALSTIFKVHFGIKKVQGYQEGLELNWTHQLWSVLMLIY